MSFIGLLSSWSDVEVNYKDEGTPRDAYSMQNASNYLLKIVPSAVIERIAWFNDSNIQTFS